MEFIRELILKLRQDEKGATVIEYALIAALISVVAILAFRAVGTNVSDAMNGVSTALANAGKG